jgi:hypothetical protein
MRATSVLLEARLLAVTGPVERAVRRRHPIIAAPMPAVTAAANHHRRVIARMGSMPMTARC